MQIPAGKASTSYRGRLLLLGLAAALQLTHFLVLRLLPHPFLASNFVQLAPPALAVVVALRQRAQSRSSRMKRNWSAVATAFCIWLLAQSFFLFYIFSPGRSPVVVRPDDALWAVFNLPMLLVAMGDEVDTTGWLDRLQVLLFFAVLYLIAFLPSIRLNIDVAFGIEDFALALCCLLRIPQSRDAAERRFFGQLVLFLIFYGTVATFGDLMHTRGMPPGSLIDLAWTTPSTFIVLLMLWSEAVKPRGSLAARTWLSAARRTQGLGIAALTFFSVAISVLLAMHRPLLGGAFVFTSFALFALRTHARERAWHDAHETVERTALHDALTGLGNRMMLRRCLEQRLGNVLPESFPLLAFVDLDRFKVINDSLGHSLGDQLLIGVADRLRSAAPAGSVVCRQGGDEFVLLASAAGPREAQAIGEALLKALRPEYHINGHALRCTASVGVVLANAGESADELLRTADHAMYHAKQHGKDCVQFFDAQLRGRINHRWRMEAELRRCLEHGALDVAFQPILTVEGGAISGFEALARWRHPVFGDVAPAEFIPLAEESGLIVPLGTQVLEKACRQVALWNTLWQTELSLSVNVSPRQFTDPTLLRGVMEVLQRTKLPPSLLQLEITETALLVDQSLARETLAAARAQGICISLDDFGTGYSSLAFLLNLPVDEVKVDRSFVSEMRLDPNRKELVRAVVQLGLSLGKRVVAEGVETEEDLQELAAMGCECVQGWHIGRPMSAEATEAGLPSIAPLARKISYAKSVPDRAVWPSIALSPHSSQVSPGTLLEL